MYHFMFSEGAYSDYMVGGLYACDHEVTEDEWDKHCQAYDKERKKKIVEMFGSEHNYWYARDNDINRQFNNWCSQNNPEQTFIQWHNMTKIEYTELWR